MSHPDVPHRAPSLGVALAGFMGAGKSTVAACVAERLALPFVDLDSWVVERSGLSSVSEIFAVEGEAGFRRREKEALQSIGAGPAVVLALGGGTIFVPGALSLVRSSSVVVVLDVPWTVLAPRLRGDRSRPLAGRAEALFRARSSGYSEAGVAVDGVGAPTVVAQRVIDAWRRECDSM